MFRKKIVIANWKMNPNSMREASSLFSEIKSFGRKYSASIVICPPYPFISSLSEKISSDVSLGSEDVSFLKQGAHTGEVSAKMLASLRVSYCIVGHSERRKLGETNELVAEKISNLLGEKIHPILCIGEKERDTEGLFFNIIREELILSLSKVSKNQISNVVIAYEPLWAISTEGKGAMEPKAIHETVIFIRKVLSDKFGKSPASKVKIIYGGSVDGKNAHEVIKEGECDGVLVGKASLNSKTFEAIVSAV